MRRKAKMAQTISTSSKAEKIILIVMGLVLAASLVVLYRKETQKSVTKADSHKQLLTSEQE